MGDRDRVNALLDEMIFLQGEIKSLRDYCKVLEDLLGVELLGGDEDANG